MSHHVGRTKAASYASGFAKKPTGYPPVAICRTFPDWAMRGPIAYAGNAGMAGSIFFAKWDVELDSIVEALFSLVISSSLPV